jgi:hypothetical protein
MSTARVAAALAIFGMAFVAGCSAAPGRWIDPAAVLASPSPWPRPLTLPPNAPPQILALWMNETAIAGGKPWSGRLVTSTNVASVEVRTESFSFVCDRSAFGVFEFTQNILDVVPQYRRPYTLHVIARNARGDAAEWLVPISIR